MSGRATSAGLVYSQEPPSDSPSRCSAFAASTSSPTGHASSRRHARRADLVLGMERRHVREAVVLLPEIMPKAFTLKELVRRGEEFGARTRGRSLEDWLVDVAGDRAARASR